MKIAEVIVTFPPYHGGMGYICYFNAYELACLGHDVTVFTIDYGKTGNKKDPQIFSVKRLHCPVRYGDGGLLPHLCTHLKGFDMVHLHYPFFGGAEYVWLKSLISSQKYFITYHMDVYGDTFLKKSIIGVYEPLFLKTIVNRAEFIISPGKEYLKESKVAHLINWKKVSTITYGGVDPDRFSPGEKKEELLEAHGLKDKTVVLFVGNLKPFKGLDVLITALSKIQNKEIVLLVVGGGYAEDEYKKQVVTLQLQKQVIFAGPKFPDEDLPDYYNLADFFVLPSTHSESFGLVVLEAMASGKPAIVTSLAGPSSLVNDGEDGFIVPIGDIDRLKEKIEYLASNSSECEEMGRRARKKIIQTYSWQQIGAQIDSALRNI